MTWRAAPATLNLMTTKSMLLTEFGGSVSADVDAAADDVFTLLTDTSRLPWPRCWPGPRRRPVRCLAGVVPCGAVRR